MKERNRCRIVRLRSTVAVVGFGSFPTRYGWTPYVRIQRPEGPYTSAEFGFSREVTKHRPRKEVRNEVDAGDN